MRPSIDAANPWLRISHPNPQARLRLFCFPYAGGAASIYRTWQQHMPTDIEVCAVQLPGRENHIREQPYGDAGAFVQALLPNLLPYLDKPFALFGHSMGSLLAYEVPCQLQMQGSTPSGLFVSGRRAPFLPERRSLLHTIASDDLFLAELQNRYQNLPAVIFEDAELRELFLPLLRADMTLVETYSSNDAQSLHCPLVALGGTEDEWASTKELQAWQQLTRSTFALHLFPGGHFYLNPQMQPLLTTISSYLEKGYLEQDYLEKNTAKESRLTHLSVQ